MFAAGTGFSDRSRLAAEVVWGQDIVSSNEQPSVVEAPGVRRRIA